MGTLPERPNPKAKDLAGERTDVVKDLLARLETWQATLPKKPEGDVFSSERRK